MCVFSVCVCACVYLIAFLATLRMCKLCTVYALTFARSNFCGFYGSATIRKSFALRKLTQGFISAACNSSTTKVKTQQTWKFTNHESLTPWKWKRTRYKIWTLKYCAVVQMCVKIFFNSIHVRFNHLYSFLPMKGVHKCVDELHKKQESPPNSCYGAPMKATRRWYVNASTSTMAFRGPTN